jgi:hypothetical protein
MPYMHTTRFGLHKTIIRYANTKANFRWIVMAPCDAREGTRRGKLRMEWVASTLHTTSEHGVSSITTADAHTSAASSRLNWRLCRFQWTRSFRRKTKNGFCACVITFLTAFTPMRKITSKYTASKGASPPLPTFLNVVVYIHPIL